MPSFALVLSAASIAVLPTSGKPAQVVGELARQTREDLVFPADFITDFARQSGLLGVLLGCFRGAYVD